MSEAEDKLDQPAKSEEPARHAKIRVMEQAPAGPPVVKRVVGPNTAMLKRDSEGAEPRRTRPLTVARFTREDVAAMTAAVLRESRDEDFAAATMFDPVFDHRFGRWGA